VQEEHESYFMYEKDRGEMPVERYKNQFGTYVAKKLLTYYEAKHKLRLVWSREAKQDLLSIWRFAADEWSPAAADQHIHDIWVTCEMLLGYPLLGRARDELLEGVRSTVTDPHVLFYRASDEAIEVLRVLHHREDVDAVFH
jgi:toxin ParE1/3/4